MISCFRDCFYLYKTFIVAFYLSFNNRFNFFEKNID